MKFFQLDLWSFTLKKKQKKRSKRTSLFKRERPLRSRLSRPQSLLTVKQKTSPGKSDPLLKKLWLKIRLEWFPDRPDVDQYQIVWSTRPQKRTLASCNIISKKVNVARELRYQQHYRWLEPLLYHEMCHAILGYEDKGHYRSWHGQNFKNLENQHPLMPTFDHWVKSGGWQTAVRSDRAVRSHQQRKALTAKSI